MSETAQHPSVERIWDAMERELSSGGEAGISGRHPVSVAWSDLYSLIQLVEAGGAPHPSTGGDEWVCDNCGHNQGITSVVPNDVWLQVSPTGTEGGVLCLWCMDKLAAEVGIPGPVPVEFHYQGQVLACGNPLVRWQTSEGGRDG